MTAWISGGVALHWGGSRTWQGDRTTREALGQRVVRDVNIVLARDTQQTSELAIDPKTGQPIVAKHASSNAVPGGDGTVERPFLRDFIAGDEDLAGDIDKANGRPAGTGDDIAVQTSLIMG